MFIALSKAKGETIVGETIFRWKPRDIFVVPSWHPHTHRAATEAVLFSFSDRPVQEKLGLWREQRGCSGVDDVIIVGAGVGGLTLALTLHEAGIPCRIYERRRRFVPIGVGINILPHATRELCRLGLQESLAAVAVATQESAFFNRFGQLIYREPAGRAAGYEWPQFSIHRGDLQMVLLRAVTDRIGADRIHTGWTCTGAQERCRAVHRHAGEATSCPRSAVALSSRATASIPLSATSFTPTKATPVISAITCGAASPAGRAFLSGASMVRAGWLATGKMVIYPIRNAIDAEGRQLINWVAEIETPHYRRRDWNRPGRLDDFLPRFRRLAFRLARRSRDVCAPRIIVLEFPMVDQEPLPRWSFGRVTLLGDAAHPMVPRGSNGAGQAILDARALADCLATIADPGRGTAREYERKRLGRHDQRGADQPQEPARRDPARGLPAHRRQAVPRDRRRHQRRRTRRAL